MRKLYGIACSALIGATMMCAASAIAADLNIGFKAEVTSADPHVLNGQNRNVWAHVYETLVDQDERLRPVPRLALSWRAVGNSGWEFKLRPNVSFHNGAPMTADDVKYSVERAMHLTGPRTFRTYLKDVESITVTSPLTVQIKTKGPSPTLPDFLGLIAVLPKSLGDGATEESFATGKSAIGTGPYKFGNWANGQRVVVARNPDYWGAKEPWDKVVFQFIPREPARASALLSGSVDLIDGATANMADTFASSNKVDTVSVTSYMLNYLSLDQFRDNSPFIKANDGAPMTKNPLRDLRVRQALMTAINRQGIIKFLMKGDATASEQIVPEGFFGYDPSMKLPAHDLVKAKALLTEAGYPDGFKMTIHCPNNRYINDAKMCEAAAQVFAQIGVKTEVSTMPFSVFLGRASGGTAGQSEFSAFLIGGGSVTGDSIQILTSTLHTQDKDSGYGANNYARYSNKQVDALIEKASQTMDEKAREALQKQAMKLALNDAAIIPLVHLNAAWAMRKGLTLKPRADGFTMATEVREAKAH
jgi:peptide/nickel transport system substrate-binding protein